MNLNEALKRLDAALSALEAAAARREEADRRSGDLETELSLMQDDRARLAVDLDGAVAKLDRLDATTVDVERRLEQAIGQVAAVIERDDQLKAREGGAGLMAKDAAGKGSGHSAPLAGADGMDDGG